MEEVPRTDCILHRCTSLESKTNFFLWYNFDELKPKEIDTTQDQNALLFHCQVADYILNVCDNTVSKSFVRSKSWTFEILIEFPEISFSFQQGVHLFISMKQSSL
jgi:hypothetical protein